MISRRRFLHYALAGLLAPALARARTDFDDIRERGSLRVAVYRDWAPFSSLRAGEPAGIDVDLARAIGARLGLPVDFMLVTPADDVDGDLRNAVWKGHYLGGGTADLMLHIPYDPELALRNDNAVLFGAYYTETLALYGHGKLPASVLDIGAQSIGVEIASMADFYLSGVQDGRLRAQMHHYQDAAALARAWREGKVELVYGVASELEAALAGSGATRIVPLTPGLAKPSWELGMATKQSLHELKYKVGDILADLQRSGQLAAIFARHQVSYLPPAAH
jgi:ABC-type amino acid transport substrate-binding protein